jgi:signal transduction histidine kinase
LVTGHPHVIYYAGVKLVSDKGIPLGTLCVIDDKPKELNSNQIKSLKGLAKQVMNLLELRKSQMSLQLVVSQLKNTNESLEKFATLAAHDLKSTLNNILGITKILRESNEIIQSEENLEMIDLIEQSSKKLRKLIEGLLEYSKSDNLTELEREWVSFHPFVSEIAVLLAPSKNVSISINTNLEGIYINRTMLYHVLMNLISNAIKYNDKPQTKIEVKLKEVNGKYCIQIIDNGPGIRKEFHEKIFNLYTTYSSTDRFGQKGNGLGLALIKRLASHSGGDISIESKVGSGTIFTVLLNKQNRIELIAI